MAWRLAKSLEALRNQVNVKWPNRSKVSDGSIGDPAHSARTSDHNPNDLGVVCAIDITHDPAHGFDSYLFADLLRTVADKRIKYIISNRRIANPGQAWRSYTGSNPHNHHVHISVVSNSAGYDSTAPWNIDGASTAPVTSAPLIMDKPTLRKGSTGDAVKELQRKLGIKDDGNFGSATERAVKEFQEGHQLIADGVVGRYSWEALG